MGTVLNPLRGIPATWQMVIDHGYTPGALVLLALVVAAYAMVALGLVVLAMAMVVEFGRGLRTGFRQGMAKHVPVGEASGQENAPTLQ